MKRLTCKAVFLMLAMLLLTGCNTTVSRDMKNERIDSLTLQIRALEQQNQALQDQIAGLTEQADTLRKSLKEGQQALADRQQAFDETRNRLEQFEQDIGAIKDFVDRVPDLLNGEFSSRYFSLRYGMDRDRLTDMGTRAEMGMLLAVTEEEGSLWATMDPVVWTGKGEEDDWTYNETTDDIRTLRVAEDTFYGIKEVYPVPVTIHQLREKMADPFPPPFVFYVSDDEVYMIAEQYIP